METTVYLTVRLKIQMPDDKSVGDVVNSLEYNFDTSEEDTVLLDSEITDFKQQ
jgi:hypothetical protein